jgi:uncharacterized protein
MVQPRPHPPVSQTGQENPSKPIPSQRFLLHRIMESRRATGLFFLIWISLTGILLWEQPTHADEALLRGPGRAARGRMEAPRPTSETQGIVEEIASAPILFYQHFLSHQWGRICAYYPSCSNFALQAIQKHGAFLGTVITFDRLQHEANEARTSTPILVDGLMKLYDPLENNDYWWYRKPAPESAVPPGADQ